MKVDGYDMKWTVLSEKGRAWMKIKDKWHFQVKHLANNNFRFILSGSNSGGTQKTFYLKEYSEVNV